MTRRHVTLIQYLFWAIKACDSRSLTSNASHGVEASVRPVTFRFPEMAAYPPTSSSRVGTARLMPTRELTALTTRHERFLRRPGRTPDQPTQPNPRQELNPNQSKWSIKRNPSVQRIPQQLLNSPVSPNSVRPTQPSTIQPSHIFRQLRQRRFRQLRAGLVRLVRLWALGQRTRLSR